MRVSDSERGKLVSLSGRVNIDSSPRVREQLLGLLKAQPLPKLTIDLSGLSYIDCSGIATLIEALKIARQCKTQLQLRGLRDGPRRLLEVIGLVRLFDTDSGPDRSPASKVS
jgi:anti-sigma B factor antagonist